MKSFAWLRTIQNISVRFRNIHFQRHKWNENKKQAGSKALRVKVGSDSDEVLIKQNAASNIFPATVALFAVF